MNDKIKINKAGLIYVVVVYVFLSFSLYKQALFFSPTKTYVSAALLLCGVVSTIYLMIRKKFSGSALIVLSLLYGAYALLTTLWSVSPAVAVEGAVIAGAAVSFLIFIPYVSNELRRIALLFIPLSGIAMYFFSMIDAVGWIHYKDAIQTKMMDSVFQYHNTFGSYELAGAVILLILSLNAKKRLYRSLYVFGISICLLGDLLSYSRWVWMLSLFMLVTVFVVSSIMGRWRTSIFNILASGVVALMATPFSVSVVNHQSVHGFFGAFVLLVGGAALTWALLAFDSRANSHKAKATIYITLTLLVLVSAGLLIILEASHFTSLTNRVHSISFKDTSFTQRFWYYANGLRIWAHNPIFGSGFGTWTTKFQAYEQYPYWSTMTHSVLIEQLDSLGLIGFSLWAAIVSVATVSAIRIIRTKSDESFLRLAALLGAASLFLHAVFDFDFNFPVVFFLFFMLLGLAATRGVTVHPQEPPLRQHFGFGLGYIIAGFLLAVLGASLTASQLLLMQSSKIKQINVKISTLKESVKLAPYNPTSHLQLAQAAFQRYMQSRSPKDMDLAWSNVKSAEREAAWDPSVQQSATQIAYNLGHMQEAFNWAKLASRDGKFSIQYQTTFEGVALWAGVGEYKQHPDAAKTLFQSVLDTYQTVKANVLSQKLLPSDLPPEWSFKVDAPAQVYAATAEYAMGEYAQSIKDLENISSVNRDSDTIGLFELVSLLDQARMAHQTLTEIPVQIQNANPLLQSEYRALVAIGS